jgi:hypothetical protein
MGGLGLCLKMTKLDLKFQAETDMSRIEWEPKMPPGSQCAKEWARVAKQVEVHEKRHVRDINNVINKLNQRIAQRQDFRVGCTERDPRDPLARQEAEARLRVLLQRAIKQEVESALKEFERRRKYLDREVVELDCSKFESCTGYHFEDVVLRFDYAPLTRSPTPTAIVAPAIPGAGNAPVA